MVTNPFRNLDGSYKTREQLHEEVSLVEQDSNLNFSLLFAQIEENTTSNPVVTSSNSLDFSGFSDSIPVTSSSVTQTCRMLRETIFALRRASSQAHSHTTPRRLSLSPVLRDIKEARKSIERNRRNSRARILDHNRRSSPSGIVRSPPMTRSRGRINSLPYVQPRVLERELFKALKK